MSRRTRQRGRSTPRWRADRERPALAVLGAHHARLEAVTRVPSWIVTPSRRPRARGRGPAWPGASTRSSGERSRRARRRRPEGRGRGRRASRSAGPKSQARGPRPRPGHAPPARACGRATAPPLRKRQRPSSSSTRPTSSTVSNIASSSVTAASRLDEPRPASEAATGPTPSPRCGRSRRTGGLGLEHQHARSGGPRAGSTPSRARCSPLRRCDVGRRRRLPAHGRGGPARSSGSESHQNERRR